MASWLRSATAIALLALIAGVGGALRADTYDVPPDFAVTCLDAGTGEVLWQTRPPELDSPRITVHGPWVVAEAASTVLFDAVDGTLLEAGEPDPAAAVGPLATLPVNLVTDSGGELVAGDGTTQDLRIAGAEGPRLVRHLADFLHTPQVAGGLIVFSLAGDGTAVRGGEVFAYDLEADALRWEFESWRGKGPPRYPLTEVAIDDDQVLVTVDQVVYSLALDSGKVLWETALPAQEIRAWDQPWTRIGRLGERLVVQCYEDLFVLDRDDGRLLWSFDAGPFGNPWPTVAGDRFYVATRKGVPSLLSFTPEPSPGSSRASFVRVSRRGRGFELATVPLADAPADAATWWWLSDRPFRGADDTGVVLTLTHQRLGVEPVQTRIALDDVLARNRAVYVKLGTWTTGAALRVEGEKVAEVAIGEESAAGPAFGLMIYAVAALGAAVFFAFVAIFSIGMSLVSASSSIAKFRPFAQAVKSTYRMSLVLSNLATSGISVLIGLAVFLALLAPALAVGPLAVLGLLVISGLATFAGQLVVLNWTGLLGNRKLSRAIAKEQTDMPADAVFVGIYEPAKKSFFNQIVDTHDDIGHLYLAEDRLVFEGLRYRREVPRDAITGFRRPLIWQFAFLGARWLAVDYRREEGSVTLCIESRQENTVFRCALATGQLADRIARWSGLLSD